MSKMNLSLRRLVHGSCRILLIIVTISGQYLFTHSWSPKRHKERANRIDLDTKVPAIHTSLTVDTVDTSRFRFDTRHVVFTSPVPPVPPCKSKESPTREDRWDRCLEPIDAWNRNMSKRDLFFFILRSSDLGLTGLVTLSNTWFEKFLTQFSYESLKKCLERKKTNCRKEDRHRELAAFHAAGLARGPVLILLKAPQLLRCSGIAQNHKTSSLNASHANQIHMPHARKSCSFEESVDFASALKEIRCITFQLAAGGCS